MDLVTAIGLFLALIGVGLTLVFVVWQPKHRLLRAFIGFVGLLAILAAIVVLVGFAPVQWRSPIVLRSPIIEQSAVASSSALSTPSPRVATMPNTVAQGEPCPNEMKLKNILATAQNQIASLKDNVRSTSDDLKQCADARRDLEHQKQRCADYRQKVTGDLGYLLDRNYIDDLLTAKQEAETDRIEANAAREEMNSHGWNQAPYIEKENQAGAKEYIARQKLDRLRDVLIQKLSELAGRGSQNTSP